MDIRLEERQTGRMGVNCATEFNGPEESVLKSNLLLLLKLIRFEYGGKKHLTGVMWERLRISRKMVLWRWVPYHALARVSSVNSN